MRKLLSLLLFFVFVISVHATPPRPPTMEGTVYGGNQPVVGAHVYLFSPGTSGAASTSLLNSSSLSSDSLGYYITTGSGGIWTATGLYSCTNGVPVYAYARYGNPGLAAGTNNTAIGLMAYLGVCGPNLASVTANINEVSTIAMAYSIAGFATGPTNISYSGRTLGLQGIINAFTNTSNLATLSSGTARSSIVTGYATAPAATINTLADILATCVNTTSATSTYCSNLFGAATASSGAIPTDTATAAINIAQNPSANVALLYGYAPGLGAPFVPELGAAPSDWTVGLTFSGQGIADAYSIAIDGSGNAWVASWPTGSYVGSIIPANTNSSVVEIANPQSMMSSGFTYPNDTGAGLSSSEFIGKQLNSIAIDLNNNVWVGTVDTLEELTSTGSLVAGSPWLSSSNTTTNFGSAYAVSIDGSNHIWVAADLSIYELNGYSGSLISTAAGYSLPFVYPTPAAIAIDGSDNVWIADINNNALVQMNQLGLATTISPSATSLSYPDGIAIDGQGNVWIANSGSFVATEYSQNSGLFLSNEPNGYALGSASGGSSYLVNMDGNGNAWFAVTDTACISSTYCIGTAELSSAGSLISTPEGYEAGGYTSGYQGVHTGEAIDGSGNVWIANTTADTVTELIGAAVPVVTPLATAVYNNTIAARP